MRPDGPRDPVVGPETPEPPFPVKVGGEVVKGFGRGSKELGIPTANIPIEGLSVGGHEDLESGVYYGWAGLSFHANAQPKESQSITEKVKEAGEKAVAVASGSEGKDTEEEWEGKGRVHPMVMSVGWNPYYKNEKRSVEVHIMHDFARDFYGARMNLLILGFIRPEYDYVSKESLIDDIKTDIEVAGRSLARPAYVKCKYDKFLLQSKL